MTRYRVHRIKETPKEQFRWAAHMGGVAIVKAKDYDADVELEAVSPYGAWTKLQAERRPLCPGDLLEIVNEEGAGGELKIAKYIGFEPAKWWVPEPRPEQVSTEPQSA